MLLWPKESVRSIPEASLRRRFISPWIYFLLLRIIFKMDPVIGNTGCEILKLQNSLTMNRFSFELIKLLIFEYKRVSFFWLMRDAGSVDNVSLITRNALLFFFLVENGGPTKPGKLVSRSHLRNCQKFSTFFDQLSSNCFFIPTIGEEFNNTTPLSFVTQWTKNILFRHNSAAILFKNLLIRHIL